MKKTILSITILILIPVAGLCSDDGYLFDHDSHLAIDGVESCQTCHIEKARDIVPAQETCAQCHDDDFIDMVEFGSRRTHKDVNFVLEHKNFVGFERYDCSSCHQQSFCVDCHTSGMPDQTGATASKEIRMHVSSFIVGHPLQAKKDTQSCYSCHEQKYCSDCHADFTGDQLAGASHRKSWSSLLTSPSGVPHSIFSDLSCQACHPDSALPAHEWSSRHARDARKNLATCQTCHPSGDKCVICHSAKTGLGVNPHPANWDDIGGKLRSASDGRTCRKCH